MPKSLAKRISVLLLGLLALPLVAQNDKFYVSAGSGNPGQAIEVGVFLQDIPGNQVDTSGFFDGYYDLSMRLTFDANLVSSIRFVQTDLAQTSAPFLFANFQGLPPGEAHFICSYLSPMPITLGGPPERFCTLEVTPSAAAAGHSIQFTFEDAETYITGQNGIELRSSLGNLDVTVGSINVAGSGGGTFPTVQSFAAQPATITAGQSSTLSWSVSDADSVSISPGIGSVAASGTTSVSPNATTTYTLTALNGANQVTATTTVTVAAANQPQITAFGANPTQIINGDSATLTWTTQNATSASLNNGIGSVATSGSRTVSPSSTTTYTLTATNDAGSVTSTASVQVSPRLTIASFSASPSQIQVGGSATLSWNVSGSTAVTLDGVTVAATGSKSVSPSSTTTYTLSASGALGQTATAHATVSLSGGAALSLNTPSVDFGTGSTTSQLSLTVNAVGVFNWTLTGLPAWLSADPASGVVDGERATQIRLTLNRDHLFPGQQVAALLSIEANGLAGTSLSVSARRDEDAKTAYLYYPLVDAPAGSQAELAAVNLGDSDAELLLQVFNANGELALSPVHATVPGHGSYQLTVADSDVDGFAWAVASLSGVAAAPAVAGCVTVRSRDGESLYGLSAETEKAEFLYVPHVASDTAVFFTNASVVNLANQSRTAQVQAAQAFSVADQLPGEQAKFSFEALLGDAIQGLTWTSIDYDPAVSAACVGAEVFGFKGASRTVGVGLSQRSYNELYFVHIAEDLNSFWTGVVVINLADHAVDIRFEPYNRQQQLINGGFTQRFEAGQKKTFVVLGDRQDFGPNASWVKVISPSGITGFELFANPAGSTADTFAGLESVGRLSRKLAFCHTEEAVTAGGVTGVAIINPGASSANLTLRLVDATGFIRTSVQRPALKPKEKLVTAVSAIFPGFEIGLGDIILVDSDQEIAGFELYGDFNHTLGAVLAAPYP